MSFILPSIICWVFFCSSEISANPINNFVEARDAFRQGNEKKLIKISKKLRQHPLYPYLEYWIIRLRIDELKEKRLTAFSQKYPQSIMSQKLHEDWLHTLARKKQWRKYIETYKRLNKKNTDLKCLFFLAKSATGQSPNSSEAKSIWHSSSSQPAVCTQLFKLQFKNKILNEQDIWRRFRISLEAHNYKIARAALSYLPKDDLPNGWILERISKNPQKYFNLKPKSYGDKEILIFAIYKAAINSPLEAANKLGTIEHLLSKAQRNYAWGQVGYMAALSHHKNALNWFNKVPTFLLTQNQKTWKVRAALREKQWRDVIKTISAMEKTHESKVTWQFWLGYSLLKKKEFKQANKILTKLSAYDNFYGIMSAELLNIKQKQLQSTSLKNSDLRQRVLKQKGIKRALLLKEYNLRYQGSLEWDWTIQDFSDDELFAAAQIANQYNWYDRAIHTAAQIKQQKNSLHLRYPLPFRTLIKKESHRAGIPQSWLYGLIRQESRFVVNTKSPAGARGLMQLMPSTAASVAKKLGIKYSKRELTSPSINIKYGSEYLKILYNQFNHPVLATAAYNAGPSRAKRWQSTSRLAPVIYIETIPISETRRYVKKVLHNTIRYSSRLKEKSRIGELLIEPIPSK